MIEEYRAVKGYEGLYEVSNFGNVKSLKRKRVLNDRILNPPINQKGYRLVNLNKNGLKYKIEVHQLIAIAFLNHVPNGLKIVIDHIDNNPLNNRLDNLQLITNRQNCSKDKKGTSNYTGVSWNKKAQRWRSQIVINGKSKYLGQFTNEIQASNAYQYELKTIQQHDRTI
jgi:hypothetical protein